MSLQPFPWPFFERMSSLGSIVTPRDRPSPQTVVIYVIGITNAPRILVVQRKSPDPRSHQGNGAHPWTLDRIKVDSDLYPQPSRDAHPVIVSAVEFLVVHGSIVAPNVSHSTPP